MNNKNILLFGSNGLVGSSVKKLFETDENINLIEAGLGWLVHLENNHEFFGRRFLEEQSRLGIQKKLVGLSIEGKAIGRKGCAVLKGEENIGLSQAAVGLQLNNKV